MTTFLQEVKEEAGPNLCKIGTFIANQNLKALKKAGKDPITDEQLAQAKANYPSAAVLAAFKKRGLHTSEDLLRKHMVGVCACATEEIVDE